MNVGFFPPLLFVAALGASTPAFSADAYVCGGKLPATMKAAVIRKAGGPELLKIEDIAVPRVGIKEVLVRVRYASVNPVDWKLEEGGELPQAVPGGDFSGEVVALGDGARGWYCGDAVAGIVDEEVRQGSYAQYVSVPVTELVAKPEAFSYQEAAAFPTVAVAAWRYLVAAGNVRKGEKVLIQGGAGGVGSVAVQIAKAKGAFVYATASTRNQQYLKDLGVDIPIDYTKERFEDVAKEIDLVVDTVGGETLVRSAATLVNRGRIVSLTGQIPSDTCSSSRVSCPPTPPWDVKVGLSGVLPLIKQGRLRVNIDRTFPLDQAADAQRYNMEGHTRGKVVIEMPPMVAAQNSHPENGAF